MRTNHTSPSPFDICRAPAKVRLSAVIPGLAVLYCVVTASGFMKIADGVSPRAIFGRGKGSKTFVPTTFSHYPSVLPADAGTGCMQLHDAPPFGATLRRLSCSSTPDFSGCQIVRRVSPSPIPRPLLAAQKPTSVAVRCSFDTPPGPLSREGFRDAAGLIRLPELPFPHRPTFNCRGLLRAADPMERKRFSFQAPVTTQRAELPALRNPSSLLFRAGGP